MLEFAVLIQGEDEKRGRWVLAVDAVGDRLLIADDDRTLRWVPMNLCKFMKAATPEVARPVILVQPQQVVAVPKGLQLGTGGNGRNKWP